MGRARGFKRLPVGLGNPRLLVFVLLFEPVAGEAGLPGVLRVLAGPGGGELGRRGVVLLQLVVTRAKVSKWGYEG